MMESSPTQGDTLVARGDALLAEGRSREAAAEYARAVQADPGDVGGHLGLAKANLALGTFGVAIMACRQVLTLAPGTAQADLAQAILYVLERRFDPALQELERVAQSDPANAYAHALRGYCLRQLGRTYDAQQAEGKARRLSSGKNFAPLFPQMDPLPAVPAAPPTYGDGSSNGMTVAAAPQRNWDTATAAQRQALRLRFATRSYPLVTYTLIAINVAVYLVTGILGGNLLNPNDNILYDFGVEATKLMQQDPTQWYRLLTAMFLHANYLHIGVNMLSLYFVGVVTEALFGRGRFTIIYFASGILAGLADYAMTVGSGQVSLGASGAIFGIFGAFGAFFILRRQMLGRAATPIIGQWLFWLVINLAISFAPGIALYDHLGGLISGFILGALLIPSYFKKQRV